MIAQLLDTAVFITIAFYGSRPIMPTTIGQYLIKAIFASLVTPLVPLLIAFGRRWLGDTREVNAIIFLDRNPHI
jgi:uncharacterized PurR-regulated membrane protein YhhQ (DUF165 family)